MKIIKILLSVIILNLLLYANVYAQIAGEEPKQFDPDTTFIFESPRPLVQYEKVSGNINSIIGGDLSWSASGIGGGMFYHYYIRTDWILTGEFFISGLRNTDEYEQYNPLGNYWRVPEKINRLYRIPFSFGVQKLLFSEDLDDTFKPYISLGVGPGFLFSVPYSVNRDPDTEPVGFFSALDKTRSYIRPVIAGAFGANVIAASRGMIGVNFKYFYIPVGGDGISSIKGKPINNAGGFLITLSIGQIY